MDGGVDTFTRIHLQWDSGGTQWRIRGELKDSTSGVEIDGSWVVLSVPMPQPLWFQTAVRASDHRGIVGFTNNVYVRNYNQANLLNSAVTTEVDYNQPWARIHQSRGAGSTDLIWVGALDIQ